MSKKQASESEEEPEPMKAETKGRTQAVIKKAKVTGESGKAT